MRHKKGAGPGRQRQAGVTLVELIAAIVILSIALVGVTLAVSSAVSRSSDTMLETRAIALAQSYLDEILARRFDEQSGPRGIPPCFTGGTNTEPCSCPDASSCPPGGLAPVLGVDSGEEAIPGPGYTRAGFNDVDDYHGLDEGDGAVQPLTDANGVERIGYDNFRIRVSVRYADPSDAESGLDLTGPEDAKLITVTVSHREQPQGWQFSVYKANF